MAQCGAVITPSIFTQIFTKCTPQLFGMGRLLWIWPVMHILLSHCRTILKFMLCWTALQRHPTVFLELYSSGNMNLIEYKSGAGLISLNEISVAKNVPCLYQSCILYNTVGSLHYESSLFVDDMSVQGIYFIRYIVTNPIRNMFRRILW